MLIDVIYFMLFIIAIMMVFAVFLKLNSLNIEETHYTSSHPLHINNLCLEPKDDLKEIRGIGKVLERLLNNNGIYYLKQIANWTKDDISNINKLIAFPGRIEREEWVKQAKALINKKS